MLHVARPEVMAGAVEETVKLAEALGAPVACTYLHNDAFPMRHPLWVGSLGSASGGMCFECARRRTAPSRRLSLHSEMQHKRGLRKNAIR